MFIQFKTAAAEISVISAAAVFPLQSAPDVVE